MARARFCLMLLVAAPLVAAGAAAQDYDRPPSGFNDDAGQGRDSAYPADRGSVDTPDPGGLSIRVGKLENRLREMTGQIEELQNNNRKLVEQLQKFQADVDARLSTGGGRQRRSEADLPSASPSVSANTDVADQSASKRKGRRDDAFDPDAAGDAPGKPKPLGSAASAQPDDGPGKGPMDLAGSRLSRGDAASAPNTSSATPRNSTTIASANAGSTGENAGSGAPPPSTPRAEFDSALGLYRDKQYEGAEKGFSAFIQKNPKSKLAADATYYLGETFSQRGRSREAAEQYLKISTDYANSTRAPDAMLHLGMSLKALGAKEQACATFAEVGRKYPNAPTYVRNGAEREAKRAQC